MDVADGRNAQDNVALLVAANAVKTLPQLTHIQRRRLGQQLAPHQFLLFFVCVYELRNRLEYMNQKITCDCYWKRTTETPATQALERRWGEKQVLSSELQGVGTQGSMY